MPPIKAPMDPVDAAPVYKSVCVSSMDGNNNSDNSKDPMDAAPASVSEEKATHIDVPSAAIDDKCKEGDDPIKEPMYSASQVKETVAQMLAQQNDTEAIRMDKVQAQHNQQLGSLFASLERATHAQAADDANLDQLERRNYDLQALLDRALSATASRLNPTRAPASAGATSRAAAVMPAR